MMRWLGGLLASVVAVIAFAQPVPSLRDDDGRPALFGTPAVRVVTLAPSLTELVYAAGAGDKLVGVSAYSDFPPPARELPQVADASGISWESLLALKPDLVLAWKGGTKQADITRLHTLGVNVFAIEIRQLSDVSRAMRAIGKLVGRPLPADATAAAFDWEISQLRIENAAKASLTVFVEISAKPLMTVNRDHVLSEVLAVCNGNNVFGDSPTLVSEPSREVMLKRSPAVVVRAKSEGATSTAEATALYRGLDAMVAKRIYGITADYAFRPGPRLILAAREICQSLDQARVSLAAGSRR
jgi:iron complex transport system substrate-binding protein